MNGVGLFRIGIRTSCGLAVDRDMAGSLAVHRGSIIGLALIVFGLDGAQMAVPIQQCLLKLIGFDQREYSSDRVVRGNARVEVSESAQPVELLMTEAFDFLWPIGIGN